MKLYMSPEFDIVQFRIENVLAYSIDNGDDNVETPVIPYKLPKVEVDDI